MQGGWGNLGGGFTNLLMPFVFLAMSSLFNGDEEVCGPTSLPVNEAASHAGWCDAQVAWRACFIFPALLHVGLGLLVLKVPRPTWPPDTIQRLGAGEGGSSAMARCGNSWAREDSSGHGYSALGAQRCDWERLGE